MVLPSCCAGMLLGFVLAVGGCGNDETAATTSTTSQDTTTASVETQGELTAEKDEVLGVLRNYFQAIADQDWSGVCETRTEKEQQRFASDLGSCEQAVQVLFDTPQAENLGEAAESLEPEGIEITKNRATVRLSFGVFHAVRENGVWKLFDKDN